MAENETVSYNPYVIVRLSDGEVKVTPHSDLMEDPIEDPAEALEAAKRISEDMEKIGIVKEIGITEEGLPY